MMSQLTSEKTAITVSTAIVMGVPLRMSSMTLV
jgi:hypothetical protein